MAVSRRCPVCNLFVSVNQLDVDANDGFLSLRVLGSDALSPRCPGRQTEVTVSDRLALICQRCYQEIVVAEVSYDFYVDHPSGSDHVLSGFPVSRSPYLEVVDGRRVYGVKVECWFLCTCDWEGSCVVQFGELASRFSVN